MLDDVFGSADGDALVPRRFIWFAAVVTLAIVGTGLFALSRVHGSTRGARVASAQLAGAEATLAGWQSTHGTYVGADLRTYPGVRLVRADAGAYCIEADEGGERAHASQPGDLTPLRGSCD